MKRRTPLVLAIAALAAGAALLVALAATPTLAGPRSRTGPMAAPSLSTVPSAVSTVTGAPTPAVPYRSWIPAPCATGGFDPLEIDADHNAVIPGHVTNCGTRADKYSFTVVAFRVGSDTALAFSSGLRPYAESGPAEVRAAFVSAPTAGTTGVCLMRSATAPIACVAIDVDAQQRITTRPLPTDDPSVRKPVLYQDDALSPEPGTGFCATCVSLR